MKKIIIVFLSVLLSVPSFSQTVAEEAKLGESLRTFFAKYKPQKTRLTQQPKLLEYSLDNVNRSMTIVCDEYFATQEFSPEINEEIYQKLSSSLPKGFRDYRVTLFAGNMDIDELIPNRLRKHADKSRLWGDIDYNGEPWITNTSLPIKISHGLAGRHLSVWASHGRYYDLKTKRWKWQRPILFGTSEDLYTQTIVVPYLIPMLENAGAVVFTPRERDWQKQEVIVDNDGSKRNYIEVTARGKWQQAPMPGFAYHSGFYSDGENPFTAGTARMIKTTTSKSRYSLATYQPTFPTSGKYAVYVSYQSLPESTDQAKYTVWHRGQRTDFYVNQQMGGGTWVYLGTFDFDAGYSEFNRVTVSNQSGKHGVVTTDAVRFGGGMGNVQREGATSGLPRALEGARYYAQWAGMPYSVYSGRSGTDDYADDINVRSFMTNYLGGGSPYMPDSIGANVPIELSLAVHSDAGYAKDGQSLIGPLSICTTAFNDGKLKAGISRMASRDFADALLSDEVTNIKFKYGKWNRRGLFDKNYSETRVPNVPSAILETLSHQSFPDMIYGQDPNFRFTLARSIYKSILRYVNDQHGTAFAVTPLTPENFRIDMKDAGEARLKWDAVTDPLEPTAKPTGYIVYTAIGNADFDNGIHITKNSYTVKLHPGILYHFKVAAANKGGHSFTTEVLSAFYSSKSSKTILVANCFNRLSSPAVVNTAEQQGFDIASDPGITYGPTYGWAGYQTNFDIKQMGNESGGLGAGGEEFAGMLIAGNDFNYVKTHAEAIAASNKYNIVSCSGKAIERKLTDMDDYDMVDVLLGLERNDGHSLVEYKTFTPIFQDQLQSYTRKGGKLFVSGAYVGTDMQAAYEQAFLSNVLKCSFGGSTTSTTGNVTGMGTAFSYWSQLCEQHYAATSTDIMLPSKPAFAALKYDDGQTAAVAYNGTDYKAFTMGFPFECIKDKQKRVAIMQGIINFLFK